MIELINNSLTGIVILFGGVFLIFLFFGSIIAIYNEIFSNTKEDKKNREKDEKLLKEFKKEGKDNAGLLIILIFALIISSIISAVIYFLLKFISNIYLIDFGGLLVLVIIFLILYIFYRFKKYITSNNSR